MSQEEDSSPSNSPPSTRSQEPSRLAASSQWTLPPDTNPASSFKFSKATPAGLASGGSKAQNGETSARAAGATVSRGLGSVVEGSKSAGEGIGVVTEAAGMSTSRDERAGGQREADEEEERRENEQSKRGKAAGGDGEDQGARKASHPAEKQQQQSDEPSTKVMPRPNQSTPSSVTDFAARFRMGQPGASIQPHSLPAFSSANPAANKLHGPQQFFGGPLGRSTPPSSRALPTTAASQSLPHSVNLPSHGDPASRSFHAASGSPSAAHPVPPPSHSSHASALHQQPGQPRPSNSNLSPRHGTSRGGQHQENSRPSTTRDEGVGGGGATNSKKRGLPPASGDGEIPRTGSNSSAKAGGDGTRAPRTDGSPSAKKRKGEKGLVGMEDVIATISSYKTRAERKEAEVASLRTLLVDKEKEVERLRTDKDTLKRDAIGKVNLALSRLESTKKELVDASSGMRAATTKLETDMGSFTKLADLRNELDATKQLFQGRYLDVDGNLWLERNEESKLATLRTLQNHIQQREEVIDLLRDQLATKTGEIVEARDRIAQLEQLQATHHLVSADLETWRKESKAREDDLRDKRVDAENRLDEALLKGREREAVLEETLARTKGELEDKVENLRKELDDARVSIVASDTETATLSASKLRLEKELKASSTEADTLKTKLESLDLSFDEFRSSARAEEERLQRDLSTLSLKNSEQEDVLKRQTVELEELRPLSSQLTKVKVDLEVAQQKLIADASTASALFESEKLVSRDLNSRIDTLVSQLHAKEAQLVEGNARLSESQNKVKTLQSSLDTLQLHEKELEARETELTAELEQARAELSATQQSHLRQDAQVESRLKKQIDDLQLEIANLKAANEALAQDQHESEQKIGELKNILSATEDAKVAAESDARRLQQDLVAANTARNSLLHFEGELAQLKRDQAAMLQTRIKETVASCQEGHSREKAQLSNELKRANNKLEELTTRNQKLSTELAKSKNRPMIDPHIASSSPAISPARGHDRLEQPEQGEFGAEQIRPQHAPTSDASSADTVATTTLSAIEAMDQEQGDDQLATAIDEELKITESKMDDKRASSSSTLQAALAPPIAVTVKKDKGKAALGRGAQSPSRALRTTRRRTMEPEQEGRNGDEDEIEDVSTQIYRPEDEIEDVTQVNRAVRDKTRLSAKTTYSKKRKDVKR